MRNCVVPRCDFKNKQNPKRAMFNVPIKDPDLLSKWKAVLPIQRPLKEFDRVCEQHFREEDILRYWEHTINGTVERMERHKPALKPNCVPVFVDVEPLEGDVVTSPKRKQKKSDSPGKTKKVKLCPDEQQTEELQAVQSISVVQSTTASGGGTVHLSIENVPDSDPNQTVQNDVVVELAQLVHPDFEALYDEVYEVELPSTLWGIHRDVEKTFISFTEFSKETMNVRKYLFIDRYLQYRMAVGQRVMKRGTLATGSTESITELLTKLDDIKIRKVVIKGSSSILGH